jgi:hypothetical protein
MRALEDLHLPLELLLVVLVGLTATTIALIALHRLDGRR